MNRFNHTQKRRLALKALGGSALTGSLLERLPAAWQRPLVQSAALPANAQLSPAPTRQFQLRTVDSGIETPVEVPYALNPTQSGQIASITISNIPASAAAAQSADWGGLLRAAHAQTANGLRVLQSVTLPFINGVASGAISIGDGSGDACDYPIRATLNSARTALQTIEGNPGGAGMRCGNTMIYPGEGLANDAGPQGEASTTTTSTTTTTTTTTAAPPTVAPTTAALTTAAPNVVESVTKAATTAATTTLDPALASFITIWRMDVNNLDLIIPINPAFGADYNYQVDWGDGAMNRWTREARHTYRIPSDYTVTITGDYPAIQIGIDDDTEHEAASQLLEIKQWGHSIAWRSMNRAFQGASIMQVTATDAPDLSRVTDCSYMFAATEVFNGDLSRWDVSRVTNMFFMFAQASAFNSDLSRWDVSSVTDMSGMFDRCRVFNGDLSRWNVSSVTNMFGMLGGASVFNADISGWDVSSVTNMAGMFTYARVFNADISGWDVSSVTDMFGMFTGASVFNADISGWNVSRVRDMKLMFSNASAFNADISGWDVSRVSSMWSMFESASAFNADISGWNVSRVSSMWRMFTGLTLSTEIYDALLINWNEHIRNVTSWTRGSHLDVSGLFSAGSSRYSAKALSARKAWLAKGWRITDGGGPSARSDWTFPLTTITLHHTAGLERMALSGSHSLLQQEYGNIGTVATIPSGLGDDTENVGYAPIRKYDGYTIAMYHMTDNYPDNWIIYHEETGRWWRFDLGNGGTRSTGEITLVSSGPQATTTVTP